MQEPIVASPKLIAQTGLPKDMFELAQKFPVGNIFNPNSGKAWDWIIGDLPIPLNNPSVVTTDLTSLLQAALAGRIFAPITRQDCQCYLDSGELIVVFDNHETEIWSFYLYRPYQTITPKRVLLVYELLEKILADIKF